MALPKDLKDIDTNLTPEELKSDEPVYLTETEIIVHEHKRYNPEYGDDRICTCGHSYYRHFDTYENMYNIGCKYCQCYTFKEKK